MSVKIRIAGALVPIVGLRVCDNGAVHTAKTVKMMIGGVLRTIASFAASMAASASPDLVSAYGVARSAKLLTTDAMFCAVTGGVAPYSYVWTVTYHTGNDVTINSPTSASTTFSQVVYDKFNEATVHCSVTDAAGNTASCDGSLSFNLSYSGSVSTL